MTQSIAEIVDLADDPKLTRISQPGFQLLIENTADGVLVVDLAGAVLYANPAAALIFGHPLEELLHVPLGRPVASGETAEITVRRPDGKAAEVEMRVVEITWDDRPALLASLRDVSARRAQEERQRQSQKLEAIGRLAAGVVHDFNNLLAAFESGMLLLKRQIARDPDDPKVATLLEEMLTRVKNGGALTQQLLAFSRQQPLAPEVVDLNDRIVSLTALLERTLGGGVEVRHALDRAVDPVLIDPNQFDIALLNLAVNAKHAMSMKDHRVLTIETGMTYGHEDPELTAGFARVSIHDTGCGMSKEVAARVFEPFFTTKSVGEGTGLGLSQVYGFVKQSGGHVHIDSEIGKGTIITLLLPKVASSQTAER